MKPLNYYEFCLKYNYKTDLDSLNEVISQSSPGNSNRLAKTKIHRERKLLLSLQEQIKISKRLYKQYLKSEEKSITPLELLKETALGHLESLKEIASGHPDNPSTQAAIRLLTKYRGDL